MAMNAFSSAASMARSSSLGLKSTVTGLTLGRVGAGPLAAAAVPPSGVMLRAWGETGGRGACGTSGRHAQLSRSRRVAAMRGGGDTLGSGDEDDSLDEFLEFQHGDDEEFSAELEGAPWHDPKGGVDITGRGTRTGVELEFLETGDEEVVIDDKVFADGTFQDLDALSTWWDGLDTVFVLLFGVGTETEGIYSLRSVNDEGLPVDIILAFEGRDDAERYSVLLEAQMEHSPEVEGMPPDDLLEFCMDSGYNCRVMPAGSLLMPSENTVEVTDWERAMRLREGMWSVTSAENEPSHGGLGLDVTMVGTEHDAEDMAPEELLHARARLEELFTRSSPLMGPDEGEMI